MTDYSNVYIAACAAICTSAVTGIRHEVHCVACMTERGIIEKEEEADQPGFDATKDNRYKLL